MTKPVEYVTLALFDLLCLFYLLTAVDSDGSCQTSCEVELQPGKIPLYIGGMFSIAGYWDGSGCLMGAELALEQINNRSDILPDYELLMIWNDTGCSSTKGPRILFNHIYSGPQKIMIIGPPCSSSAVVVSPTASYWNLITLLYSASLPSISDRKKYPNVYRSIPVGSVINNLPLIWFMKQYDWRRLAFLTVPSEIYLEVTRDFVVRSSELNSSVIIETITDSARLQIENLKKEDVRIIATFAEEVHLRTVFCEAYRNDFIGVDKVWTVPGWLNDKWWLTEDDNVECSPEEVATAVESSVIIGFGLLTLSPLDRTTVAGMTPAAFLEEVERRLSWPRYEGFTLNSFVAYTFDSVWSMGLALNSTATILSEQKDSRGLEDFTYSDDNMYGLFYEELASVEFFGASGQFSYSRGERLGSSDIKQLKGSCPTNWNLHQRFCYRLFQHELADWKSASALCKSDGAVLANLSSEEIDSLAANWGSLADRTHMNWYVGTSNKLNNTTYDCMYVNFGDNTLRLGDCREERPFICKTGADFTMVPVAVYSTSSDEMFWTDDIVWPGGSIPRDRAVTIPRVIERIATLIPAHIHILVTCFATAGVSMVVMLMVLLSCHFRTYTLLDNNVLLGCLLMYLSVIFAKSAVLSSLTDHQHVTLCQVQSIIASVGFILSVSTLVAMIWMVYKTATISETTSKISDITRAYLVIGVAVIADAICIVFLHIYYPIRVNVIPQGTEIDPANPNHEREYHTAKCSHGDGIAALLLTFTDKVMLLLIGAFFSFEVQQAADNPVEESKQLTVSIYNIILFGVCGLTLVLLLSDSPTNAYVFSSVLVICCTSVTLLILFVPKIKHAVNRSQDDPKMNNGTEGENKSSTSAKENAIVRGELLEKNARLKKQYEQLRQLVEEKRKAQQQSSVTMTRAAAVPPK